MTLVALLPLLAGCATFAAPSPSGIEQPVEWLDVTPAAFYAIAWPEPDTIIVLVDTTMAEPGSAATPHTMRPDGSSLAQLAVVGVPACLRTAYGWPTRLPDGRLGFALGCSGQIGPADWSLWALDLSSGETEALAVVPDERQPDNFSWRADMSTAWYGAGSDICQGIRATGPGGPGVLDIRVGTGDRSFTLEEAYQSSLGGGCVDVGWADYPAWSPTDDVVAFVASTAAIGREGTARLDAPGDLYLWDPATQQLTTLLEGFVEPRGLRWSPDGQWLAFTGKHPTSAARTWLFRPADGMLVPLSSVFLEWFDWSPDGSELMGVVRDISQLREPDGTRLVRIPLPTGIGTEPSPMGSGAIQPGSS